DSTADSTLLLVGNIPSAPVYELPIWSELRFLHPRREPSGIKSRPGRQSRGGIFPCSARRTYAAGCRRGRTTFPRRRNPRRLPGTSDGRGAQVEWKGSTPTGGSAGVYAT